MCIQKIVIRNIKCIMFVKNQANIWRLSRVLWEAVDFFLYWLIVQRYNAIYKCYSFFASLCKLIYIKVTSDMLYLHWLWYLCAYLCYNKTHDHVPLAFISCSSMISTNVSISDVACLWHLLYVCLLLFLTLFRRAHILEMIFPSVFQWFNHLPNF